jgi:hypothetical protein
MGGKRILSTGVERALTLPRTYCREQFQTVPYGIWQGFKGEEKE